MRARRSTVGRVAVVAAVIALIATATPMERWFVSGASAAPPLVTVTPNSGLADTQTVTVTGSGFSSGATIFTVECTAGAVIPKGCGIAPLGDGPVIADDHGNFTVQEPLRRLLITQASKPVDCAFKPCEVAALNIDNFGQNAAAAVSFDPNIPPIVPTLTLKPSANLVDHQLVAVTGKGFTPNTLLDLEQCASKNTCATDTTRLVFANSSGSFTAKNFPVERVLNSFNNSGPVSVDCAAKVGKCSITANGDPLNPAPKAPLGFDATKPPLLGSVSVTPASGLTDLQRVTVHGTNFVPGGPVEIAECVGPSEFGACDFDTSQSVTPGLRGDFTLTFAVHRLLPPFFATSPTAKHADCADAAGSCSITATTSDGNPVDAIGLTFNKAVKPAVPAIVASPAIGLHEGQDVRVTLTGFAPARPISIVECDAKAFKTLGVVACDSTTEQITSAPAGVAPVTSIEVHRAVSGLFGLADCTTKAGACILVAQPFGGIGGIGGISVIGGPLAASGAPGVNQADAFAAKWHAKTGVASITQQSVAAASAAAGVPNLATVSLTFAK